MERLWLVAALLVGIAACGERSTPFGTGGPLVVDRSPDAPLTAAFDSASLQIEAGATIDLPVEVSGGDPDEPVGLACLSAAPDVLEATANSALQTCRVTGLASGFSTVTATATAGDETISTQTTVTVLDPTFGN